MATFIGLRAGGTCDVYRLDGRTCERLHPRRDVRDHSPCGFEWGYGGSGPAQLALALLCDVTEDRAVARELYQDFKRAVVAQLPKPGWILHTEDVEGWILWRIAQCRQTLATLEVIATEGE